LTFLPKKSTLCLPMARQSLDNYKHNNNRFQQHNQAGETDARILPC
jgi:hypothetical protein